VSAKSTHCEYPRALSVSAESTLSKCLAYPLVSDQSTHKTEGRLSRLRLCVLDLQGAPSEARKVEPTECHAHDTAAVATDASHYVHGTTPVAEGADHAHPHATGATGRAQKVVAPADASDHEHGIAAVAAAADRACTSRTAFPLDDCMAIP
jgi:hypothetical protein